MTPETRKTLTDEQLLAVLERARTVGFLGPGPLRVHLDHARAYLRHLPEGPHRLIDLGSGGGLPGVPLLADRSDVSGVLLDAAQKRVSFLVWALTELGLTSRGEAIVDRAEVRAHDTNYRGKFQAVVCRGFGPPHVTIECGVAYLGFGGRLLISEPPGGRRWPSDALERVGLRHVPTHDEIAVFERIGDVPLSIPRSAKQMQRSPLF